MITGILCARPLLDPNIRSYIRKELAEINNKVTFLPRSNSVLKNINLHKLYKFEDVGGNYLSIRNLTPLFTKFGFYTFVFIVDDRYLISDISVLKNHPTYEFTNVRCNLLLILLTLKLLRMGVLVYTYKKNQLFCTTI